MANVIRTLVSTAIVNSKLNQSVELSSDNYLGENTHFFIQNYSENNHPAINSCKKLAENKKWTVIANPFDQVEFDPLSSIDKYLKKAFEYRFSDTVDSKIHNQCIAAMILYKCKKALEKKLESDDFRQTLCASARFEEINNYLGPDQKIEHSNLDSFINDVDKLLEPMGGFHAVFRKFNFEIFGVKNLDNLIDHIARSPQIKCVVGIVEKEAFDLIDRGIPGYVVKAKKPSMIELEYSRRIKQETVDPSTESTSSSVSSESNMKLVSTSSTSISQLQDSSDKSISVKLMTWKDDEVEAYHHLQETIGEKQSDDNVWLNKKYLTLAQFAQQETGFTDYQHYRQEYLEKIFFPMYGDLINIKGIDKKLGLAKAIIEIEFEVVFNYEEYGKYIKLLQNNGYPEASQIDQASWDLLQIAHSIKRNEPIDNWTLQKISYFYNIVNVYFHFLKYLKEKYQIDNDKNKVSSEHLKSWLEDSLTFNVYAFEVLTELIKYLRRNDFTNITDISSEEYSSLTSQPEKYHFTDEHQKKFAKAETNLLDTFKEINSANLMSWFENHKGLDFISTAEECSIFIRYLILNGYRETKDFSIYEYYVYTKSRINDAIKQLNIFSLFEEYKTVNNLNKEIYSVEDIIGCFQYARQRQYIIVISEERLEESVKILEQVGVKLERHPNKEDYSKAGLFNSNTNMKLKFAQKHLIKYLTNYNKLLTQETLEEWLIIPGGGFTLFRDSPNIHVSILDFILSLKDRSLRLLKVPQFEKLDIKYLSMDLKEMNAQEVDRFFNYMNNSRRILYLNFKQTQKDEEDDEIIFYRLVIELNKYPSFSYATNDFVFTAYVNYIKEVIEFKQVPTWEKFSAWRDGGRDVKEREIKRNEGSFSSQAPSTSSQEAPTSSQSKSSVGNVAKSPPVSVSSDLSESTFKIIKDEFNQYLSRLPGFFPSFKKTQQKFTDWLESTGIEFFNNFLDPSLLRESINKFIIHPENEIKGLTQLNQAQFEEIDINYLTTHITQLNENEKHRLLTYLKDSPSKVYVAYNRSKSPILKDKFDESIFYQFVSDVRKHDKGYLIQSVEFDTCIALLLTDLVEFKKIPTLTGLYQYLQKTAATPKTLSSSSHSSYNPGLSINSSHDKRDIKRAVTSSNTTGSSPDQTDDDFSFSEEGIRSTDDSSTFDFYSPERCLSQSSSSSVSGTSSTLTSSSSSVSNTSSTLTSSSSNAFKSSTKNQRNVNKFDDKTNFKNFLEIRLGKTDKESVNNSDFLNWISNEIHLGHKGSYKCNKLIGLLVNDGYINLKNLTKEEYVEQRRKIRIIEFKQYLIKNIDSSLNINKKFEDWFIEKGILKICDLGYCNAVINDLEKGQAIL